jgi:prepilin-type N-terminal cleavage/methylation domain-containing protein
MRMKHLSAASSQASGRGAFRTISAFTLIELLAVIAIIGILAAFILAVAGPVQRVKYINTTTAEMGKIETALDNYKKAYGAYPPAGTNALINPLYYELVGATNNNGIFTTLDGAADGYPLAFGMSGFVNCNKPGSGGENSAQARDFLLDLKPNQVANITNSSPAYTNNFLVVSVGGPEVGYAPAGVQGANPWRYAYPGTNNPNSYDLWAQLVINRKTNLVCNWSSKVQINAPYP